MSILDAKSQKYVAFTIGQECLATTPAQIAAATAIVMAVTIITIMITIVTIIIIMDVVVLTNPSRRLTLETLVPTHTNASRDTRIFHNRHQMLSNGAVIRA